MAKAKIRQHNEWFRPVMASRKGCPCCGEKIDRTAGEEIWSWGEYIRASWHTVKHFCRKCAPREVIAPLASHAGPCGCQINLVRYHGGKLPEWLKLPEECNVAA